MIQLDGATVLLQWAVGGLLFLWVTTRRREVSLGYGWLMRSIYGLMAIGSVAVATLIGTVPVRDVSAALVAVATGVALIVSVVRKRAGVAGERARIAHRQERVYAMTGIERAYKGPARDAPEFPPWLDLVAPVIGVVGLVAAGIHAGHPVPLSVARTLVGAAFLGSITDAMLLGHWYLVQPGLERGPLLELVRWALWIWPAEVAVLVVPTGMVSVLDGSVNDHYNGLLGFMWVGCAVLTGVLLFLTRAALKERYYSAVMAATGLLYLAILTAFGTDLVARAVLAGH